MIEAIVIFAIQILTPIVGAIIDYSKENKAAKAKLKEVIAKYQKQGVFNSVKEDQDAWDILK